METIQPRPTLAVCVWQREVHSPMGSEYGRGLHELRVAPWGPENTVDVLGGKPRLFCREEE